MVSRRDLHERGIRGPMAMPNPYTRASAKLPLREGRAEFFFGCLTRSMDRIQATCPEVLIGVDIGIEDVPDPGNGMWSGLESRGAVPLALAIDPQAGRSARVIIYRRPIERRATSRDELQRLVHHTLVEQLSVLTARSVTDIDPRFDDEF
jgi:hypothetical protein